MANGLAAVAIVLSTLDRTQPLLPMRPGQIERRSHDYVRYQVTQHRWHEMENQALHERGFTETKPNRSQTGHRLKSKCAQLS